MHITKPADTLFWLTSTVSGEQPLACFTVAYLIEADGTRVAEPLAWRALLDTFGGQAFDEGQKKARGTFAVAGNACAPAGTAVRGLVVRARVGSAEKTLHVFGERRWQKTLRGWRQTSPALFDTLPLDRSRAFGGPGWASNPDGRGFCAGGQMLEATLLPNLVTPAEPIAAPDDRPGAATVATFRPLSCAVPQRARYLGAIDARWVATQCPHWPQDTDSRYFDAVAEDQCIAGHWRGDETYEVHGMHARHAVVEGRLPGLRPRLLCRLAPPAKRRAALAPGPRLAVGNDAAAADIAAIREVPLQLDTVWLLPNQQRVLICYRGQCATAQIDNADVAGLYVDTEQMDRPAAAIEALISRWRERMTNKGLAATESPGTPAPAPEKMGDAMARSADPTGGIGGTRAAEQMLAAAIALRTQAMLAARDAAIAQGGAIAARHGIALGMPGEPAVPAGLTPVPAPKRRTPPEEIAVRRAIAAALADAQHRFDTALAGAQAGLPASARRAAARLPGVAGVTGTTVTTVTTRATRPTGLAALRNSILEVPLPAALQQGLAGHLTDAERAVEAIERTVASATQGLPGGAGETRAWVAGRVAAARAARGAATIQAAAAANSSAAAHAADTANTANAMNAAGAANAVNAADASPRADMAGHGIKVARRPFDAAAIRAARASGIALTRIVVHDADLAGFDLRGVDLSGSEFVRCDFTGACLERARLCDVRIVACRFDVVRAERLHAARLMASDSSWRGARLLHSDLSAARCERCDFTAADLSEATLAALQFIDGALREARLHGALAPRAVLRRVDCTGLDATRANLTAARLEQCAARGACFTDAMLAGSSWWEVAAPRASFARANLANARSGADCNFEHADFTAADLRGAGLRDTLFTQAVLHRARLDDALFANCDLGAVDARGACAVRADFNGSDLGAGHWRGANLMHAALRRTRLDGADFRAANLHGADVSGAHATQLSLDGALLTRCRLAGSGCRPKVPA